ncbi:MAG: serine--tRNA ligase [SAR202 cluster bacterium]|jgi:seryl-tRNA synthetase|nr:serine--tRNA ligase [Chloroflexota bacterium]MDP6425571.1 serine--tRNA ligase [Dehalococcoidia bacterium]MDP7231915.1 serine--tRNA ligase [Dehalococcoidia bacterium]MDP7613094.1 serine--tRNA ligase [Dehalococcoidia bacterium]MQG46968.1 serine--tRNA ligase [SAR202 cluster bacterium]
MLDVENIISNHIGVKQSLKRRGVDLDVELIQSLNQSRKDLITKSDALKSKRNNVSRVIGNEKRQPTKIEIEEMRSTGDEIKSLGNALGKVKTTLTDLLLPLPNIPSDDVPDGLEESKNIEIKRWGQLSKVHGEAHWDIGLKLGILDMESGASISGSRFYVLKGRGAKLQRALSAWMLDVHTNKNGYIEIDPPYLVKHDTMVGSGNLPKFKDNLYHDDETDLWLIPTAEVVLNGLHQGQIIDPSILPLKYVARTASFRKEHAAAGRDVRGIKRVHQFEKVEMFRFVEPEEGNEALEQMLDEASELCEKLELSYRVVELCAGELGFQSAKTYDIEVWAPGSGEWLEVSSISNCKDFQTRRNNTRYRPKVGSSTRFPHTLNGSGLALPRIWIAILENGLKPDGSVTIPEVLHDYTDWKQLDPILN